MKLALDHFGTGSSSLRMLRHFPVDLIKIDSSFVSDVLHDENDAAVQQPFLTGPSAGAEYSRKASRLRSTCNFLSAIGVDCLQAIITTRMSAWRRSAVSSNNISHNTAKHRRSVVWFQDFFWPIRSKAVWAPSQYGCVLPVLRHTRHCLPCRVTPIMAL